jgi:oxygen-independent coproporphyrinogen-3 oxidase
MEDPMPDRKQKCQLPEPGVSPLALEPLGLYCHIPFCPTLCDFCSFSKQAPDRKAVRLFLEAMATEWQSIPLNGVPQTWFWGGGTPTLLHPDDLQCLGGLLRERVSLPAEWTVEVAPSTVNRRKLEVLREMGVSRISIGAQSFQPGLLKAMGRDHHPAQIHRTYQWAREVGFASVSLDLIFAVPGQTAAEWRKDLDSALELQPDHLSTYCLTFEEDTALWVRLQQGKIRRSLALEEELYRLTWDVLEDAGFEHYEVSNFARPGHACLHNQNTWRMHAWIGVGPSAASQWRGHRFQNPFDLEAWRNRVLPGMWRLPEDAIPLTPELLLSDALGFGLRTAEGVHPQALATRWGVEVPALVNRLLEIWTREGLLTESQGWFRPTREGLLRADHMAVEMLDAF